MKVTEATTPNELFNLKGSSLYDSFAVNLLSEHHVDIHFFVSSGDEILARCSIWWKETPKLGNEKTGIIGHFATINEDASNLLLRHACQRLAQEGCIRAVGPMNGNTWQSYRFVIETKNEPAFFLEPSNPLSWPTYWQSAGFQTLATYTSAKTIHLETPDPRLAKVEQRMSKAGISIRGLRIDRFEQELNGIYDVSISSFKNNFLYSPITKQSFVNQYLSVKPFINPELVLIAEHNEKTIGFLFALRDINELNHTGKSNTLILKTVAILPSLQYAGIGALLVSRIHQLAASKKIRNVIHALMHDNNNSKNISGRYAETIRRYALFSKKLASS